MSIRSTTLYAGFALLLATAPARADRYDLNELGANCADVWAMTDPNELSSFSDQADRALAEQKGSLESGLKDAAASLAFYTRMVKKLNDEVDQAAAEAVIAGSKTGFKFSASDTLNPTTVKNAATAASNGVAAEGLLAQVKETMDAQARASRMVWILYAKLLMNTAARNGLAACVADQRNYLKGKSNAQKPAVQPPQVNTASDVPDNPHCTTASDETAMAQRVARAQVQSFGFRQHSAKYWAWYNGTFQPIVRRSTPAYIAQDFNAMCVIEVEEIKAIRAYCPAGQGC